MSKSIAHRIPGAGAMLLVALLSITLSMAACEDDAQSVRQANESAAASTATAETPTPSAEIHMTELNPNPPKDTDGRLEESGRGVRELQGK